MKQFFILLLSFMMVGCSSEILDERVVAVQTKGDPGSGGDLGLLRLMMIN